MLELKVTDRSSESTPLDRQVDAFSPFSVKFTRLLTYSQLMAVRCSCQETDLKAQGTATATLKAMKGKLDGMQMCLYK